MDVHKGHAAASGDPVEFALPEIDRFFAKEEEKSCVLREGVRKLDVTGAVQIFILKNFFFIDLFLSRV